MLTLLQKFRDSKYSVPIILTVVTLLAYGLFAAQQGFHWDDWGFVWMARFGGNERLFEYFSVARPVLAYLYMVTLRLIGPNPLAWQIFALIWRAASAIAMWWALRQVFVVSPAGRVGGGFRYAENATQPPPPYRDRGAKQSSPESGIALTASFDYAPLRSGHRLATLAPGASAGVTEQQIFWVSLLTLLYPGFSQHSIAIAYGHYSLLFTVFWLSLGLMVVALRAEKRKWLPMSAALLLSAWSLFSAEYAFGLELLRPFFLCFALANLLTSSDTQHATRNTQHVTRNSQLATSLRRVARIYLPYLLILASFLIWRVFIFGFHMYQAELFDSTEAGAPLALSELPRTVMDAILTAAWRAWLTLLDFTAFQDFSSRLLLLTLAILLGSFAFLLFYDSRFTTDQNPNDTQRATRNTQHVTRNSYPVSPLTWITLGLLALLTAGIPFYVANLPIQLGFPNDRFLMSFAFGAASLLVGLTGLIPNRDYRAVALSLLVALSMGKQIQYAHAFREDWEQQKSFFWQLAWRAPRIQPHTVLLSDDSAIRFSVDYSLAGPLNWIYNPDNPQGDVNYAYFFIGTRLHHELPDLKENLPIETNVRLSNFHGSTSDMLVFQFRPPACLHILDPRYDSDLPAPPNSIDITRDFLADGVPVLTARTLQALPLSDPTRIIPDPARAAQPPAFLFGTEPPRGWCYYFQQADLARQQDDWSRVAALGDEAFAIPFYPNDASEFLPFIEAYLRLGRADDAREWTRAAHKQMPIIAPAVCGVWQRVKSDLGDAIPNGTMEKVISELKYCPAK